MNDRLGRAVPGSQVCSALQPPAAALVWPSATLSIPQPRRAAASPPVNRKKGKNAKAGFLFFGIKKLHLFARFSFYATKICRTWDLTKKTGASRVFSRAK
ncbi:hypothetical protein SGRA_2414 [Saprospira grandis str. Lewin]|uniref:Uncharacterized protein n=1 Tax=Saprospira grandis (strain Lewin) TaxID=984262 RepID=H6L4W7_SAPGL|nr:hypothetical protein SGRA_2414 [Saprospira grandis str. Lewin]